MNQSEENWVILTESPACALPLAVLMQLPQAEMVSMWHAKDEDEVTAITSDQTSVIQVLCVYDTGRSFDVCEGSTCQSMLGHISILQYSQQISIFLLENYSLILSPYTAWFRQSN